MHIIARDALWRPYKLIGLNYQWQPVTEQEFASLEELAKAASYNAYTLERNASSWMPLESQAVRQKALSPRGKLLNIVELVSWGRRLRQTNYWSRYGQFVFRSGPVSCISKWRGGSSTRNCQTQNERRGTAMVLREEGEVAARAVRHDSYLPSSWDGRRRIVQRCWKSQHKGCKSWDRAVPNGNGRQA